MKRFDFLASVAVALGMGKLFPSLLRPQTETFVLEWDAEGPDLGHITMSVDYWDRDHWVNAASGPLVKGELTYTVPEGFNSDIRISHIYGRTPDVLAL